MSDAGDKCIIIFDVKSMYPAIIIGENISPEMKIVTEVMGERVVKFKKDKVGLIPKVVRLSLDARDNYRELRLKAETDELAKRYGGMEKSAKVGANATYGVLLYYGYRLFDPDCAGATTRAGRRIIRRLAYKCLKENIPTDILKKIIHAVIYGDTDSLFIMLYCRWDAYEVDKDNVLVKGSRKPINRVNDYLQGILKDYCKELNYTEEVEGKVEAILERIIFKYRLAKAHEREFAELVGGKMVVGAKKKYAAKRRWLEGSGVRNDHYIKGFGRSDVSEYTKRVYGRVWEALLDEGNVDRAIRILREAWTDIRNANWYDISVPRSVKANFKAYKEDSLKGGHIGATLYMIEHFGIDYNPMIKPRTVCIIPRGGVQNRKLPIVKRIALLNGSETPPKRVLTEFDIDYHEQAITILKKPFELLVYSLGRQWSEVESGTRQMTLDHSFEQQENDTVKKEAKKQQLDDKLDDQFAQLFNQPDQ